MFKPGDLVFALDELDESCPRLRMVIRIERERAVCTVVEGGPKLSFALNNLRLATRDEISGYHYKGKENKSCQPTSEEE